MERFRSQGQGDDQPVRQNRAISGLRPAGQITSLSTTRGRPACPVCTLEKHQQRRIEGAL